MEISFSGDTPSSAEIQVVLKEAGITSSQTQLTEGGGFITRFQNVDENVHQDILDKFRGFAARNGGGEVVEKQFTTIGPTIGKELKNKSISALILALVAIVLYIAWAFRHVSRPVSSWKYGICAIAALAHDTIVPVGIFAALGHYRGVEVDTLFITALLTILGFSVHDTIVVFDRIRENLKRAKIVETFEETVNRSVNETISRSLNTSLTVLFVLLAVFFLGGESVKYFSLALVLGIIFGTYSSIFIASPLVTIWNRLTNK